MSSLSIPGMFLGLALGDAWGQPLETHVLSSIMARQASTEPDLYDRGLVDCDKGDWGVFAAGETSDDTQLSVAIARALLDACRDSSSPSQDEILQRVAARQVEAYKRSTKGWGPGTVAASERLSEALELIPKPGKPWLDSGGVTTSGNGAMMKLLPLIAWHASRTRGNASGHSGNQEREIDLVIQVAAMTHRSTEALVTAVVYHEMVTRLFLQGHVALETHASRQTFFASLMDFTLRVEESIPKRASALGIELWAPSIDFNQRFSVYLAPLLANAHLLGASPHLQPNAHSNQAGDLLLERLSVGGTSNCLSSLAMVVGILLSSPLSFNQIKRAVFIGGDTDTNGSMVGGIVGALLGPDALSTAMCQGLVCDPALDPGKPLLPELLGIAKEFEALCANKAGLVRQVLT